MLSKRSVDELFIIYFQNMSSASGGFVPRPHRGSSLDSTSVFQSGRRKWNPGRSLFALPGINAANASDQLGSSSLCGCLLGVVETGDERTCGPQEKKIGNLRMIPDKNGAESRDMVGYVRSATYVPRRIKAEEEVGICNLLNA